MIGTFLCVNAAHFRRENRKTFERRHKTDARGGDMKDEQEKSAKAKKQVPLRLSASLYAELMAWAEEDFRSLNGQIEYLLTECVRRRKKGSDDS